VILNIRGTFGSGKSTIVTEIMRRYPSRVHAHEPDPPGKRRRTPKPAGYRVDVPWLRRPLLVVGPYKTACGGCDGIQPYTLIWPRVVEYAAAGHVLFEGAMVSSSYGTIGRASEPLGHEFVFGFMDTPLEECIRRVRRRRAARGDVRPLDDTAIRGKYRNVVSSISTVKAKGRRIVFINHKNPVPQVLGLFLEAETAPVLPSPRPNRKETVDG
jgi:hypothetical protein